MSDAAAAVPELTYDKVHVGLHFASSELTLTPAMVADYGRAVHNPALAGQASSPAGTPLEDPSLVVLFAIPRRILIGQFSMPPGGVLARQDFEVERPLRLGETVRTAPHIIAKYEKRGRRYVEMQCDLQDATGSAIAHVVNHIIWAR